MLAIIFLVKASADGEIKSSPKAVFVFLKTLFSDGIKGVTERTQLILIPFVFRENQVRRRRGICLVTHSESAVDCHDASRDIGSLSRG